MRCSPSSFSEKSLQLNPDKTGWVVKHFWFQRFFILKSAWGLCISQIKVHAQFGGPLGLTTLAQRADGSCGQVQLYTGLSCAPIAPIIYSRQEAFLSVTHAYVSRIALEECLKAVICSWYGQFLALDVIFIEHHCPMSYNGASRLQDIIQGLVITYKWHRSGYLQCCLSPIVSV